MPVGADEFGRRSQSIKHSSGGLGLTPAPPETGSVRQYITGGKRRRQEPGVEQRSDFGRANPVLEKERGEKKKISTSLFVGQGWQHGAQESFRQDKKKIHKYSCGHTPVGKAPTLQQHRGRRTETSGGSPTFIFKACALFFGFGLFCF